MLEKTINFFKEKIEERRKRAYENSFHTETVDLGGGKTMTYTWCENWPINSNNMLFKYAKKD